MGVYYMVEQNKSETIISNKYGGTFENSVWF